MTEQQVFLTEEPSTTTLPPGIEKSVEEDDPYALTGVRYPVADGVDADREVALAVIEEYALSGWSRNRIRALFSAPQSGSIHKIARRRGGEFIDELLTIVFGISQPTEEHQGG